MAFTCNQSSVACDQHSIPDAGGSKPKEAAQDAADAAKSALPAEPQQAAKDAASAAKDSLPEPPKDLQNPIQNFFSGTAPCLCNTNWDCDPKWLLLRHTLLMLPPSSARLAPLLPMKCS